MKQHKQSRLDHKSNNSKKADKYIYKYLFLRMDCFGAYLSGVWGGVGAGSTGSALVSLSPSEVKLILLSLRLSGIAREVSVGGARRGPARLARGGGGRVARLLELSSGESLTPATPPAEPAGPPLLRLEALHIDDSEGQGWGRYMRG